MLLVTASYTSVEMFLDEGNRGAGRDTLLRDTIHALLREAVANICTVKESGATEGLIEISKLSFLGDLLVGIMRSLQVGVGAILKSCCSGSAVFSSVVMFFELGDAAQQLRKEGDEKNALSMRRSPVVLLVEKKKVAVYPSSFDSVVEHLRDVLPLDSRASASLLGSNMSIVKQQRSTSVPMMCFKAMRDQGWSLVATAGTSSTSYMFFLPLSTTEFDLSATPVQEPQEEEEPQLQEAPEDIPQSVGTLLDF